MRVSWSVIAFGRPKVVDRFGLNGIQVNESQKGRRTHKASSRNGARRARRRAF